MKKRLASLTLRRCRAGATLAGLCAALLIGVPLHADDAASEPAAEPPVAAPSTPAVEPGPEAAPAPAQSVAPVAPAKPEWIDRGEVVAVGNDIVLHENERASKVVAVGGNVDIRGPVDGEVVAVFGDVHINARVGKLVAVLGDVSLGEKARVDGEAIAVGGDLDNPHHVPIRGDSVEVGSFIPHPSFGGFMAWVADTSTHVRLLSPHVAWPWTIFGVGLVFLFLLAVVFGRGMNACARSLEERPAATLTTALGLLPGLPLFTILLICTVLGILLLPFLGVAVLFGAAFGKAAMMVFLGRSVLRVTGAAGMIDRAWLTLLIGAVVLAVLYCVPVLGVLVWALTGWIGLGMVVVTLIEKRRREKAVAAANAAAAAKNAPVPPVRPTVSAAVAPVASVVGFAADAAPTSSPFVSPSAAAEPSSAAVGGEPGAVPPPAFVPPPPVAAPLSPAVVVPVGPLKRADFGVRLWALLIDVVLIWAAGLSTAIVGVLPFPLLFGVYAFAMWLWKGSTVGGIIFKLQVVRLDGRPMDPATAVVRTLVAFLSAVTLVGFLWCLWDDEGQTWHDKVAGTNVMVLPKSPPLV
jgi:uncharacterized RDD family membrane protein YckC